MKRIIMIGCLVTGLITAVFAQTHLKVTSDPVEKAKELQKQLKLSDEQTSKVSVIYQESAQKFDKIKKEEHGNTNKMMVAIGPLRTATIKKIKAVLTPKQVVKYDKLIKESKSASGNGWNDGWSATAEEN
jgi:protein CpxP